MSSPINMEDESQLENTPLLKPRFPETKSEYSLYRILKYYQSKLKDNFFNTNDNILNNYFKKYIDHEIKKNRKCIGFFYILSDNDRLNILVNSQFEIKLNDDEAGILYSYLKNNKLDTITNTDLSSENIHGGCTVESKMPYSLDKLSDLETHVKSLFDLRKFVPVTLNSEINQKINEMFTTYIPNNKLHHQLLDNMQNDLNPYNIKCKLINQPITKGILIEYEKNDSSPLTEGICNITCKMEHLNFHTPKPTEMQSQNQNFGVGALHINCDSCTAAGNKLYKRIDINTLKNKQNFNCDSATRYDIYKFSCNQPLSDPLYKVKKNSILYDLNVKNLNIMFNRVNFFMYLERILYDEETCNINRITERLIPLKTFIRQLKDIILNKYGIYAVLQQIDKLLIFSNFTEKKFNDTLFKLYDLINVLMSLIENKDIINHTYLQKINDTQIPLKDYDPKKNVIKLTELMKILLNLSNSEYKYFKYAHKKYQDVNATNEKIDNTDKQIKIENETEVMEKKRQLDEAVNRTTDAYKNKQTDVVNLSESVLALNPDAKPFVPIPGPPIPGPPIPVPTIPVPTIPVPPIPVPTIPVYIDTTQPEAILKYCTYCNHYLHTINECCVYNLLNKQAHDLTTLNFMDDISKSLINLFYLFIHFGNKLYKRFNKPESLIITTNINYIYNTDEFLKKLTELREINDTFDLKLIEIVIPLIPDYNEITKLITKLVVTETTPKLKTERFIDDIKKYYKDNKSKPDEIKKLIHTLLRVANNDRIVIIHDHTYELKVIGSLKKITVRTKLGHDFISEGGKKKSKKNIKKQSRRNKYKKITSKKL